MDSKHDPWGDVAPPGEETVLDVFVALGIMAISLWVGHAGVVGLMKGEILAILPFVLGSVCAAYFGVLGVRIGFALLEDRPDSPEEYGDNGTTIPH